MRLIDASNPRNQHYVSQEVIESMQRIPPIDPESLRPTAEWIVTKEYHDIIDMDVVKYTCSACGKYRLSAIGLSQATNYCPNCGARMKGAENNA